MTGLKNLLLVPAVDFVSTTFIALLVLTKNHDKPRPDRSTSVAGM
jgi:hypothetical protein